MRKFKFAIIMLAMLLLLAACGSEDKSSSENNNNTGSTESKGAFPMTVSPTIASTEDRDSGLKVQYDDVTLEKMPERIVVFDYGFLDTLDALGVEGIVGLPKDSTLPAHLEKYSSDEYTSVGTLKEPLLEDIAALEPDVIFISGRQAIFYDQLKEITPNVLFIGATQDDYWNTFLKSVDIAAQIFDKQEEADEYLAKFDTALEEIKALAGNFETSLVTMYNEGKLSGFATNSRFGYVYDVYGFVPVTEDIEASSHGSNFGFEAILEFDPEVLFVIDRTAAIGGQSNIEKDMENEIIQKTTAYKNDRIVYLDGPLWYLAGGGLQSELMKIEEVLAELK
ncbi:siderophore ABC transporter substrate-binding protein [Pallidibacillus pasinlerensis]|uniref:Siderophore ABC transporter substrate-binding protein n=1 Tax=Pallidibacillus pasinlerensis TaxID=2703818 RepID=A0ABX0A5Q7_9BACI|nr:siderophore ABC transporter substrate-binding protein [Pallidibacillus pasinlerensis]NCU18777.1 siderophore ABC transporter substrate-binding protein [Pallidibacillus pasinlerensis]